MTDQTVSNFVPVKATLFGLVVIALIVAMTVAVGFWVAYELPGEATLRSAMAIFIFPSPYLLFALVGFAMVHNRSSKVMAITFNIGALILLITWVTMNFIVAPAAPTLAEQLDVSLVRNTIASAIVMAVLILVLYLETSLVWPGK